MVMLEILFFAMLAGYLFFRLWGVLGDRSGFDLASKIRDAQKRSMVDAEKIQDDPENDEGAKVLPFPYKNKSDVSIEDDILPNDHPHFDVLKRIENHDPTFHLGHFLHKTEKAFRAINAAFIEGDKDILHMLLTPDMYARLEKAIEERAASGQSLVQDILSLKVSLLNAQLKLKKAAITLRFESDERLVTYDKDGKILDNFEEVSAVMLHDWTFIKDLSSKDPVWYVAKTASRVKSETEII